MKPKRIELRPIRTRPSDFDALEDEIRKLFRELIYAPLVKLLGGSERAILNSKSDLTRALMAREIVYESGRFTGRFRAAVTKELKALGAVWDKRTSSFSVPIGQLPGDVRATIQASAERFRKTADKIEKALGQGLPAEVAKAARLDRFFSDALFRVDTEFKETVKGIAIAPKFTKEQADRIAAEYTKNMQLYIQDWTEKEIKELRERVAEKAVRGERYESLAKEIQASYGVSQRKAKFLARQETSLLMTKFKQVRYESAGVRKYKWATVHNPKDSSPDEHKPGNVRYYHGLLDGKVFSWENPPIVDEKGNRKNPGQDCNCRCTAIPIVEF